jgi:protein SCO1/2
MFPLAMFSERAWRNGALLLALSGVVRRSAVATPRPPTLRRCHRLGRSGPSGSRNQAGRSFSEQSLNGQVWVAAFMFTRCPTICPELTRRMRYLQEQAQARKVTAAFAQLQRRPGERYARGAAAITRAVQRDTASWSFLTGDNSVIRKAAEEGFKIVSTAR